MNARLSTSNVYDATIEQLTTRQGALGTLQEQLSSGKRILRASDDPAGAAEAERAGTRIARLAADQKAMSAARDSMSAAESTLGNAVNLMQSARDAVVAAGNGSYSSAERQSLAQQLSDLRSQLLGVANQCDANGQYLFSGAGAAGVPFTDGAAGVSFNGVPGQTVPSAGVPHSLDGHAIFMSVPGGNGVFQVAANGANTGAAFSDGGQVTDPTALTGHDYSVQFSGSGASLQYSVTDSTTGATVLANQNYKDGQAIAFDGQSLIVKGTPAAGDSFQTTPSQPTTLFSVLDKAIAALSSSTATSPQVMQSVQQTLQGLDAGLDRLQVGRSQAGEWMNRADASSARMDTLNTQLANTQSQAQDMDMIKGISDFQNQQTAYSAALKAYAQVQQLSLIQYLNP